MWIVLCQIFLGLKPWIKINGNRCFFYQVFSSSLSGEELSFSQHRHRSGCHTELAILTSLPLLSSTEISQVFFFLHLLFIETHFHFDAIKGNSLIHYLSQASLIAILLLHFLKNEITNLSHGAWFFLIFFIRICGNCSWTFSLSIWVSSSSPCAPWLWCTLLIVGMNKVWFQLFLPQLQPPKFN